MKQSLVLAFLLVVVVASAAHAQIPPPIGSSEGAAVTAVHAKVVPNIAIRPLAPIVDAGSPISGDISTGVVFLVHANTQSVRMWVTATDLFKGDVPLNPTVPPIRLDIQKGARIQPSGANVLGGGSNVATLPSAPNADVLGFPGYQSTSIDFESMDAGTFSHDVTVSLSWKMTNNEQPMGDYGGRVMLSAMCLPSW